MKSILISTIILGNLLFQTGLARALPEKEVINKLDNIPTFALVDNEGSIVPLKLNNSSNSEALVFINPQDAQNTLQSLKQKKPTVANRIRVMPVSLSTVYELIKTAEEKKAKQSPVEIVAMLPEIRNAINLITAEGTKIDQNKEVGIPLFYGVVGQDENYIIKKDINNNSYIPFYWTKKEAEEDLKIYQNQLVNNQVQPTKVKVIFLSQFIDTLLKRNNEAVKIMQIVPSVEQINTANQLLQ